MSALELLVPQPNFPDEDLTENNSAHVEYYLQHEAAPTAYERHLKDSLRMVHKLGYDALQRFGVDVAYAEDEYYSFCSGFASIEYTGVLVRERQHDQNMLITNAKSLFIDAGMIGDVILSNNHQRWMSEHPNTYGVVVGAGEARGESMRQLHSRIMGAHVASRLQVLS